MTQGDTERYLLVFAGQESGGEPLTTAEVAAATGDDEGRVRAVLDRLVAEGRIESKSVGSERVWWSRSAATRERRGAPLVPPEQAIESFMRVTPVGAILLDERGAVVRANDRARDLLGFDVSADDAEAPPWVVGRPDSVVARVVAAADVVTDVEAVHDVDGVTVRLSVSAAPVTGPAGVERVFVVFDSVDGRSVDAERVESERLARLVSTFRTTTRVMVEATTRAQLESHLCHGLVDDGPYAFAWVGRVRWVSETVDPVQYAVPGGATAGWRPASTDDIDVGPAAKVVEERTAVVLNDLDRPAGEGEEPWRRATLDRGFRSMAAIPLAYGGRLFGVLSICSREPGAFGSDRSADVAIRDEDTATLTELGRAVGHALSALERRDALLSERFVEVEFRSASMGRAFAGLPREAEVVLDQTVPLDDDTYVDFYRVSGTGAAELASVLAARDDVETVRVIESEDDGGRVAAQTVQPTVAGLLATHGGRTREIRIRDGVVDLRAELPQFTDVQEIARLISDQYDDATLVNYRTNVRERHHSEDVGAELRERLTDRQWSALELAYYGGYFEWPRRGGSLEDIAADLGVAAQTANEHLRKAEAKVFSVVFDSVRPHEGRPSADGS